MKNGFEVIVNDFACITVEGIQYRFPVSKKKRIRKKWKKRGSNYKMVGVHKGFQIGNKLYVSQKIFDKLKQL